MLKLLKFLAVAALSTACSLDPSSSSPLSGTSAVGDQHGLGSEQDGAENGIRSRVQLSGMFTAESKGPVLHRVASRAGRLESKLVYSAAGSDGRVFQMRLDWDGVPSAHTFGAAASKGIDYLLSIEDEKGSRVVLTGTATVRPTGTTVAIEFRDLEWDGQGDGDASVGSVSGDLVSLCYPDGVDGELEQSPDDEWSSDFCIDAKRRLPRIGKY